MRLGLRVFEIQAEEERPGFWPGRSGWVHPTFQINIDFINGGHLIRSRVRAHVANCGDRETRPSEPGLS